MGRKPKPDRPRRGNGRGDASPPAPVSVREKSGHLVPDKEIERPPAPARRFEMDDREWIARLTGEGHAGTGGRAPAFLAAVRFYAADEPDAPVREALIARGRFESLYDEEFHALFQRATDIRDA